MKALIFNSGLGSRMGEFSAANHKAMARLGNGETIFARQLRILRDQGITDFVVTTGPFADQLADQAERVGVAVRFVPNDVYDSTNYIYSLYLAREHLDDDVLMLHGDLVFNTAALTALLADPRPDLGAVNAELPQPDKDFKARVEDGRVTEVSVSIFDADCLAFQPLYKLSRRAMKVWLDRVADFVEAGNTKVYAENALNEVTAEADIKAFSYAEHSVNEVDTLDDLARVSAEIRGFDFAEQPVLDEPNAYRRIPQLLAGIGARKPLVVGGGTYAASAIKPYLAEQGVDTVEFGGYSANPKLAEVLAGVRLLREARCDSIISLGGGSALDVAKCIKLLAAAGGEDFPSARAALQPGWPHLAIPSTAGTGSEATHFAVVYIDGEKHSIAHDAMLPEWALLEPTLLDGLPDYHKRATILDALCQSIESVWATAATPQSRRPALEAIRLILDNLFAYFHPGVQGPEVNRAMLRAAHLSGKAINITKTTAPHAMSYKLTSMYGTAHGHAVGLCMVGVWQHFVQLADAGSPDAVAVEPALDLLTEAFGVTTRAEAVGKFMVIMEFLQLAAPELKSADDLDELVGSVNAERLANSPVPLSSDDLRRIYEYLFDLRTGPEVDSAPRPPANPEGYASVQRYTDLHALQAYQLEMLTVLDQFCTDHGLQYYLSEGSMLGAVRHGGPIPWDDDLDVMMPRADYTRLVGLVRAGKLPDGYALDSFETNPLHWVLGAKLQITRPTEFHLPEVAHVALHSGPYLDIFPVDSISKTSGPIFAAHGFLLRLLRRMLFMRSGRTVRLQVNPGKRIPIYLLTRLVPLRAVQRWVVWAQSRFNSGSNDTHWANLCSYYPIAKEVFDKESFGAGRRVEFGGVSALIPTKAEHMLQTIYGPDYSRIPTMEQRRSRMHAFAVAGNTLGATGPASAVAD